MAPRKTKNLEATERQLHETAQPDPNADALKSLDDLPRAGPGLIIDHREQREVDREQRFNVALAIWPKIAAEFPLTPLDDENEAGAAARIAFEYADAFIAQSRKGQVDAE